MVKDIGYKVAVLGVVLPLIWIGIFKFTLTEAEAIKPMVENSPLMSWLYSIFSVQGASRLIGSIEIIVAIGLIASLKFPKVGAYAGMASTFIFLGTLSFLFTTPGTWKTVDGVYITNFFILKDIVLLGASLMVVERSGLLEKIVKKCNQKQN